jgi:hypothetical protein
MYNRQRNLAQNMLQATANGRSDQTMRELLCGFREHRRGLNCIRQFLPLAKSPLVSIRALAAASNIR